MEYSQIIKGHIKSSGKSLRKIARECAALGVPISPTYISKLKNGRHAPPSDKVNMTLAKVLGCNQEELLLASYRQKIPGDVLGKLVEGGR